MAGRGALRTLAVAALAAAACAGSDSAGSKGGVDAGPDAGGGASGAGAGAGAGTGGVAAAGGTSSGGAGASGAAGAAGAAGSAPSWPAEPSAWKEVPGSDFSKPDCTFYEGLPGDFPAPVAWQPCGDGCEALDPRLPGEAVMHAGRLRTLGAGAAARVVAGMAHTVRLSPGAIAAYRLVSLAGGATLAALRYVNPNPSARCLVNAFDAAGAATLLSAVTKKQIYARVDFALGAWVFGLPPIGDDETILGRDLLFVDAPLVTVSPGRGVVAAQLDAASSAWTVLESPSGADLGAANGDLAVWIDFDLAPVTRVRGWTASGGIRTIQDDVPIETCELGLGPEHLVGVALEPYGDYCRGPATELWYAKRAYASGEAVTHIPVPQTPPMNLGWPETHGDHAVSTAMELSPPVPPTTPWLPTGDRFLVVHHLPTGRAWRLDPHPGYMLQLAHALTAEHVYWAEVAREEHRDDLSRFVRVPLARLDELGTRL